MLVIKAARKPVKRSRRPQIGLAVAGGGPIGGIFEIGAVRALEDAIEGLDMNGRWGGADFARVALSGAFLFGVVQPVQSILHLRQ